jgi:hypothetical protein
MELIMNTITYKEVDSFLFNNIQQHQFLSEQPRELNEVDMDFVSGGNSPFEQPKECPKLPPNVNSGDSSALMDQFKR